MAENKTYNDSPTFIPARLESSVHGLNPVADAKDIYDINHGKWQKDINDEIEAVPTEFERIDGELEDRYTKEETYSKTEVDTKESGLQGQIDTIKGGSTKSIATIDNEINSSGGIDERLSTVEELAQISIDGGTIGIATASDFDNPTPEQEAKVTTVGAILGVTDDIPTAGSDNLVKSGGVAETYGSYGQSDGYIQRLEDADEKVIMSIKQNGDVDIPQLHSPRMESLINKQVQGVRKDIKEVLDESSDIENRIAMTLDKDGKVVSSRKEDGTLVEPRLQVEELFLGSKAKEAVRNAASTEKIIIVDKNGTGDYTSLLKAVMASQGIGKCTIVVNSGEYDLISEYKAVFGNDYFDNYTANYNGYRNGRIDAGLFLWPDVTLKGNGFVRIKFDYQGNNTNVKTYFAPINTTNNVVVEDITITTNEDMCCRYLIHDDFAQGAGVNIFRNIVFEGNSNGGSIIGAGMGVANTYIVENCYFTNEATFDDINYHNNGSESTTYENLLMVRNCKGGGKCVVQSLGNSDRMTKCIVSNSEFTQILSRRSSSQTYDKDNMELIKFLNNETNV